jgi:hypothetical protein
MDLAYANTVKIKMKNGFENYGEFAYDFGRKNRRGTQLKRFRGTGIPYTRIREPTPF